MKPLQQYRYPVFDFDGTIAELCVDWASLRDEVYRAFNGTYRFRSKRLLYMYETILSSNGKQKEELIALVRSYEQPQGKVMYRPIDSIVACIRGLSFFYIVSNNLHSTVQNVLQDLDLTQGCRAIIGFGDASAIKPSIAPFESLVLLTGDSDKNGYLYVGDSPTDKEFAFRVGITFAYPQEIV
jgi:phosphoglycolate phosphatase-like HAD superfamily hydrolase